MTRKPGGALGNCWRTTNDDDGRIDMPADIVLLCNSYRTVPARRRRRQVGNNVRLYTAIGRRDSVWQYCKKNTIKYGCNGRGSRLLFRVESDTKIWRLRVVRKPVMLYNKYYNSAKSWAT